MPKVVLIMEYVVDIDRADETFDHEDFTDEEFDRILAILRLKRKMPGIPGEGGIPNPSISAQLMYDAGEEEEIEELKRIAHRKKEEEEERKKKGSAASRAYKKFLS